jgi:hypothetical protein
MRILTLFLTRDASTFIPENYKCVLEQDVYVISAEPIPIENNIVVKPPQAPVPVRIGVTVNVALKKINIEKYTHIFKVDGDNLLPRDYLKNLLLKDAPVAGIGCAMLIKMDFFLKVMHGKYPVNYCDDGYIFALSMSLGFPAPIYSGAEKVFSPWSQFCISKERTIGYGGEYWKWGLGWVPHIFCFASLLLYYAKRGSVNGLRIWIWETVGRIRALVEREEKYFFSERYSRIKNNLAARKLWRFTK